MNLFAILEGMGKTGYLLSFLALFIISEIIFFIFIRTTKREHNVSLWAYTVSYKAIAWMASILSLVVLGLLLFLIKPILVIGGIVGLIFAYLGANYWLAKNFSKQETKEEYEKRTTQHENSVFKKGDKVRLKRRLKPHSREVDDDGDEYYKFASNRKEAGYLRVYPSRIEKYKNQSLTIAGFDSDGDLYVREDGQYYRWSDVMFEKVNSKKRRKR